MTITLNDTHTTVSTSIGQAANEYKSSDTSGHEPQAFADMMSNLLQGNVSPPIGPVPPDGLGGSENGQTLADPILPDAGTNAWPDTSALQAFTLGPHLNVITAQAPAPNARSLEAFARSQGLDEQAVHWLFGSGSVSNPSQQTVGLPSLGESPTATSTLPNPAASQPSDTDPATASLLVAAQALWRTAEDAGSTKTAGTASDTAQTSEDGVALNLLRMPPPAAVWMQRSALLAQQNPTTATKTAEPSLSELDLGSDWAADLEILSLDTPSAAPNGASTTGTHGSAYANFAARWDAQAQLKSDTPPPTPLAPSDTTSRSESIQNLADKMGHAIGQRILSEMEKGQWHLKLQLRPATLGHIEVEMRMRSGEFDAVFTAPHHLTRDLLQDGMNRLKDTLSQMGMDVASIHVQDGQTGQRGGDSTPGAFAGKAKEEAKPAENVADKSPVQPIKKSSDGLDILV